MDLKTYLAKLDTKARKAFALKCGSTPGHLRNISYGYRACAESLAIAIEKETKGLVRCEVMRPDVDWAYLRGTSNSKRALTALSA